MLDSKNNLSQISNSQFSKYMRDTEIVEEVSMRLFKMHMAYSKEYNARNPCSVPMKCNLNEIKANLPDITKYTFTDFRNLMIT